MPRLAAALMLSDDVSSDPVDHTSELLSVLPVRDGVSVAVWMYFPGTSRWTLARAFTYPGLTKSSSSFNDGEGVFGLQHWFSGVAPLYPRHCVRVSDTQIALLGGDAGGTNQNCGLTVAVVKPNLGIAEQYTYLEGDLGITTYWKNANFCNLGEGRVLMSWYDGASTSWLRVLTFDAAGVMTAHPTTTELSGVYVDELVGLGDGLFWVNVRQTHGSPSRYGYTYAGRVDPDNETFTFGPVIEALVSEYGVDPWPAIQAGARSKFEAIPAGNQLTHLGETTSAWAWHTVTVDPATLVCSAGPAVVDPAGGYNMRAFTGAPSGATYPGVAVRMLEASYHEWPLGVATGLDGGGSDWSPTLTDPLGWAFLAMWELGGLPGRSGAVAVARTNRDYLGASAETPGNAIVVGWVAWSVPPLRMVQRDDTAGKVRSNAPRLNKAGGSKSASWQTAGPRLAKTERGQRYL